MNLWTFEKSKVWNLEILKCWNVECLKSRNSKISKFWNLQILKLKKEDAFSMCCQVLKFWNVKMSKCWKSDCFQKFKTNNILKLRNVENSKFQDFKFQNVQNSEVHLLFNLKVLEFTKMEIWTFQFAFSKCGKSRKFKKVQPNIRKWILI